jgi:REP element-mobilizing transposase RayT
LHGDERGSTDRFRNVYKTPHIPANKSWLEHNTRELKTDALTLSAQQRHIVETAIRETCLHRNWRLHVLNVRTNHVHVIVSIGKTKPEQALNAFKSNSTRKMREEGSWQSSHSPWADKGSKRYLWNDRSVALAIDYVINGQGGTLPDLD